MSEQPRGFVPPAQPPVASQHPWGPPSPEWGSGPWAAAPADQRPGTVLAAAIITWILCATAVAMTLVFLAFAAFIGAFVLPNFEASDRIPMVAFVLGSAGASFVASGVGIWLAVETMRRKRWARVALAAWAGVAAILSATTMAVPVVLAAPVCLAVLVLLLVPATNAWFRAAT